MSASFSEPDNNGFDGIYIGSKNESSLPPNDIDFASIIAYMKATGKQYSDLTKEEVEQFKFAKPSG